MIVRYADDFKLFCKTHEQAVKMYHATKQWLKERLKLDVSEEKTKIVNLKTEQQQMYIQILKKLPMDLQKALNVEQKHSQETKVEKAKHS